MADEQYRWLNRDAAERLLSGKPLEAVDPDTRARADRLAEALGALAAEAAPEPSPDPELPGEEAALAAFRTARTTSWTPALDSGESGRAEESGRGGRTHPAASPAADAGVVHLGRPARTSASSGSRRARWGRPVRFGLVAAVAAGMLGGVTVVAGGGALSVFRGDEPEPSATVSAGRSPDRPLMSPSPDTEKGDDRRGAWGQAVPDESPAPSSQGDAPSGEGTGGADEDERSGASGRDGQPTPEWWRKVTSACRDVRDGKELTADRRRGLEDAAGGRGRGQLKRYCEGVLSGGSVNPGGSGKAKRWGAGTGTGASGNGGPSVGGDKDTRSGNDSDDDDDAHHGKGRGGHGNGKSRHGNGRGDGKGLGHGNGKNKGGKNKGHQGGQGGKGNKGGKGSGGSGHRGQFAAVTPVGFGVGPATAGQALTHPS
ncbi:MULTISPECIES: hypothetical protein [Streptomyces]|uniref:Uncharacterized protein n=1 Tax=Streptomyces stelliscabiei TaxID=146820 RepID=A0A8I0PBF9_9ACTN|nr:MULTISPECIES: hypothetical protein [Streptomyces]MBE1599581.1 hypothetical protein [Streptomyces stelliscabiei]MDX2519596.1 hypothetical protein [Streptomyces stelliscabiei]SOD73723.1 hypothetical protein SAMN06272781_3020 [Streptomyces sp. 1222.2]